MQHDAPTDRAIVCKCNSSALRTADKAGGDFVRRLACNISPDFGKVGFGGIREAKG
jgi:hypothetical protein